MNAMDFKETLEDDLKTFLNFNEFGELAIIEGESVTVVLDADKMTERQLAKGLEGDLHNEALLFYVEKSKLSFYPRPDNTAIIDGVKWRIKNVQEDIGLFTVTVEANSG